MDLHKLLNLPYSNKDLLKNLDLLKSDQLIIQDKKTTLLGLDLIKEELTHFPKEYISNCSLILEDQTKIKDLSESEFHFIGPKKILSLENTGLFVVPNIYSTHEISLNLSNNSLLNISNLPPRINSLFLDGNPYLRKLSALPELNSLVIDLQLVPELIRLNPVIRSDIRLKYRDQFLEFKSLEQIKRWFSRNKIITF